jgi:1-Cys peroxiredoxin 6
MAPKKGGKKVYDYSGLEKGMRVQAESDGVWYAADVLVVSTNSKRSKAPVKVAYKGWEGSDEWLGGDRIRSKALKVSTPEKKVASSGNPLKIGATIPNFSVKTTKGDFKLHDWLTGDAAKPWTLFFSHPKDFTPVCTTELGACHQLSDRFAKIGVKLIGVSCDSVEDHHAWSKDVLHRINNTTDSELAFPIIADAKRGIVTKLGMLDPEERDGAGVPLPARALVVLNGTTVKLTILYPATTGRNFEEVFRVITSLQLTAGEGLATPVNWEYGQRVIVGPPVPTDVAKEKFEDFQMETMPSGKEYLRSVKCPPKGLTKP